MNLEKICNDFVSFPQTHLQSCDCKIIPCPNPRCQITLERRLVNDHVINTCQWRTAQCEHCDEKHAKCDEEVNVNRMFITSCKFISRPRYSSKLRRGLQLLSFEIIFTKYIYPSPLLFVVTSCYISIEVWLLICDPALPPYIFFKTPDRKLDGCGNSNI